MVERTVSKTDERGFKSRWAAQNKNIMTAIKKSEILKQEAAAEDNDLKAMGIDVKVLREERKEKFEEIWLPSIKEKYKVELQESLGRYLITTEKFGLIQYYPKANKVFLPVYKNKGWRKPGLKWIVEHLNITLPKPKIEDKPIYCHAWVSKVSDQVMCNHLPCCGFQINKSMEDSIRREGSFDGYDKVGLHPLTETKS